MLGLLVALVGKIGLNISFVGVLFSTYKSLRITFLIVLVDLLFVSSKATLDYLITTISNNITMPSMPDELCYIFNGIGIFEAFNLAISFYFTVSLTRLIIKLASKVIS